ncbi:MAG TPA: UPF0182 family protein [Pyrinomonadaceae bacterium]
MSDRIPLRDSEVIDVNPRRRRRWVGFVIGAIVVLLFAGSRLLSVYLSAEWFGSLGFSAVYWYIFKLKAGLFFVFAILTTVLLRSAFRLLEKTFAAETMGKRTILINNQPMEFSPERLVRPVAWALSVAFGLFYGFAMMRMWERFALYSNQIATSAVDPIFGKPISFYLFTLPVYELISSWVITLSFVALCAAIVFSLFTIPSTLLKNTRNVSNRKPFAAVSIALAVFLVALAFRVYLARFPYLWQDHQIFTGVTFTEANYLLPALLLVSVALLIAAAIAVINALSKRGLRLLIVAIAIPVAVYLIGVVFVPAYVNSFIVKPNELARETPYIEHNIAATRRGFGLEQVELREFPAEPSLAALDLANNRATLENIRLWDWRALQDTLKQIQAIRNYYDFPDVDVDRYRLNGVTRQTMVAAREISVAELPESSRNWINEKLIYTHSYGLTMNTANGFTPEGMPLFVVSNMPVETKSSDIKVTRPQIYYGQQTNTDVYVKTRQKEFDYPQGESATYTTYEGTGGIPLGGGLRRLLLAWAVGDLSKLPFSDDIAPESRVLINRNIRQLVNSLAPFLIYDSDPYLVIGNDGNLFWIIDAYTEASNYPYSRHHQVGPNRVNYIRNSVKVVIDAYNGATQFYVFDQQDPLIAAYRSTFPSLFNDASQMRQDLREHIRYPESLIRVQGEVYGLYHTQSPKVFFQREDVWNIGQKIGVDDQGRKQPQPIDPYFVLMQLPGEQAPPEFVLILPFTPAGRNNMIGWMAGRSDGENYGKVLIYNFPESRLVDGPLQIEARIDQNSDLSEQFTLWNQQGSRVLRGHLLVIPIGKSLLYVEPIYLRAESSPMPELRMVVLGAQDRLAYGPTFDEALRNLAGDAGRQPASEQPAEGQTPPTQGGPQPSPSPGAPPPASQSVQQLVNRAIQEFEEYQRLTSQGKLAEAGQKLEQHKRTLEELKRVSGRQP